MARAPSKQSINTVFRRVIFPLSIAPPRSPLLKIRRL